MMRKIIDGLGCFPTRHPEERSDEGSYDILQPEACPERSRRGARNDRSSKGFTFVHIIFTAVILILIFAAVFFVLNIEVTTRQGVDYKVQTLRLPLYLKMLDFYDRHFNYKLLAGRITAGAVKDEDKVMAIFKWTVENLREQPKELKVIDDHVWHIIVRGYGVNDQFSDVFTTLCDYAGLEAFFARVDDKEKRARVPFSFVKVDNDWRMFHPYNGAYFINKTGHFASVEEIIKGDWSEVRTGALKDKGIVYKDYFGEEIANIVLSDSHRFSRANIQSPINRFIYGIRKKFRRE